MTGGEREGQEDGEGWGSEEERMIDKISIRGRDKGDERGKGDDNKRQIKDEEEGEQQPTIKIYKDEFTGVGRGGGGGGYRK